MVDNMSSNEIRQVEQNLSQAKKLVAIGEALQRLYSNRDFKKVIIEGFFEQEAIRLVHLKSDPAMSSNQHQENILKQMDAIGNLNQYFMTITKLASIASKTVDEDENTLAELLMENGDE